MNVHFSSQKLDWQTPDDVYDKLHREFNFDFDPTPVNPTYDGLEVEWGQSNFCNPPYGKSIYKFIEKGYNEAQKGKTVVFLIPSRTDTQWWHKYCMKADEIRFIEGRLRFKGAIHNAPFPSALVIFKGEVNGN